MAIETGLGELVSKSERREGNKKELEKKIKDAAKTLEKNLERCVGKKIKSQREDDKGLDQAYHALKSYCSRINEIGPDWNDKLNNLAGRYTYLEGYLLELDDGKGKVLRETLGTIPDFEAINELLYKPSTEDSVDEEGVGEITLAGSGDKSAEETGPAAADRTEPSATASTGTSVKETDKGPASTEIVLSETDKQNIEKRKDLLKKMDQFFVAFLNSPEIWAKKSKAKGTEVASLRKSEEEFGKMLRSVGANLEANKTTRDEGKKMYDTIEEFVEDALRVGITEEEIKALPYFAEMNHVFTVLSINKEKAPAPAETDATLPPVEEITATVADDATEPPDLDTGTVATPSPVSTEIATDPATTVSSTPETAPDLRTVASSPAGEIDTSSPSLPDPGEIASTEPLRAETLTEPLGFSEENVSTLANKFQEGFVASLLRGLSDDLKKTKGIEALEAFEKAKKGLSDPPTRGEIREVQKTFLEIKNWIEGQGQGDQMEEDDDFKNLDQIIYRSKEALEPKKSEAIAADALTKGLLNTGSKKELGSDSEKTEIPSLETLQKFSDATDSFLKEFGRDVIAPLLDGIKEEDRKREGTKKWEDFKKAHKTLAESLTPENKEEVVKAFNDLTAWVESQGEPASVAMKGNETYKTYEKEINPSSDTETKEDSGDTSKDEPPEKITAKVTIERLPPLPETNVGGKDEEAGLSREETTGSLDAEKKDDPNIDDIFSFFDGIVSSILTITRTIREKKGEEKAKELTEKFSNLTRTLTKFEENNTEENEQRARDAFVEIQACLKENGVLPGNEQKTTPAETKKENDKKPESSSVAKSDPSEVEEDIDFSDDEPKIITDESDDDEEDEDESEALVSNKSNIPPLRRPSPENRPTETETIAEKKNAWEKTRDKITSSTFWRRHFKGEVMEAEDKDKNGDPAWFRRFGEGALAGAASVFGVKFIGDAVRATSQSLYTREERKDILAILTSMEEIKDTGGELVEIVPKTVEKKQKELKDRINSSVYLTEEKKKELNGKLDTILGRVEKESTELDAKISKEVANLLKQEIHKQISTRTLVKEGFNSLLTGTGLTTVRGGMLLGYSVVERFVDVVKKRHERDENTKTFLNEFVTQGFQEWWGKLKGEVGDTKFERGLNVIQASGTLFRVGGFALGISHEVFIQGDIQKQIGDMLKAFGNEGVMKTMMHNYAEHGAKIVHGISEATNMVGKGAKSVGNVITGGYFEDEAPPVPPGTTPGGGVDAARSGASNPVPGTGRAGDAGHSAPDTAGTSGPDAAHPDAPGEQKWRLGVGTVSTDAGHDTITDIISQQLGFRPESFGLSKAEAENKQHVLKLAVEIARKMKFIEGQGTDYHDIRLGKDSIGNVSFLLEKQGDDWNVNIVDAHTGAPLSREELLKNGKLYANDKPLTTHHHDAPTHQNHHAKELSASTGNSSTHIPTIEELEAGVRLNNQAIYEKRHENDVPQEPSRDLTSRQESAPETTTESANEVPSGEKMTVGNEIYQFQRNKEGQIINLDGPELLRNFGEQTQMDKTMSELTGGILGDGSHNNKELTKLFVDLTLIKSLRESNVSESSDEITYLKNIVKEIISQRERTEQIFNREHPLLKNIMTSV